MYVKKVMQTLHRLYQYGEANLFPGLEYLKDQQLVYELDGCWIITRSWINYVYRFQKAEDFIRTLFCFEPEYQRYLLHYLLVEALKMREFENTAGLKEFVNRLPRLAGQALSILYETYGRSPEEFPLTRLEERIAERRDLFRDIDLAVFDGLPYYQRILFYLEKVQLYELVPEPDDKPLGTFIDAMWERGRKISALTNLPAQKTKPLTVLAPFVHPAPITNEKLVHVLSHPWILLMFILGIIREQYEVEGERAISFRTGQEEVLVLLTSCKGKELLYGSLSQFTAYLCQMLDYALFPHDTPDMDGALAWLHEQGIFTVRDGEYRLMPEVEERLYISNLGITFISKSKQLTANIKRFIDELREKQ